MSFIPTLHTNPGFNELLEELGAQLNDMVNACEQAIRDTCEALDSGNIAAAKRVIACDEVINELELKISETVAVCVARYQPVASDLHALMSSIKVAADLERLADHAKNICRRLRWLQKNHVSVKPLQPGLLKLGQQVHVMLGEIIDAVKADEPARCAQIWKMDIETNDQYKSIMEQIVDKSANYDRVTLINALLIAKNFERIGDKIKNLAEEIYFQKTGEKLTTSVQDD